MMGDSKAVAPAGMLAETTLCTSLFFQVIVSPTLIVPKSWGVNRFWPAGTCTVRGVAAGGTVGTTVGATVGTTVGTTVGGIVIGGMVVGATVGARVGAPVGATVGATVGVGVDAATTVNWPTIAPALWVAAFAAVAEECSVHR